MNHCPRLDQLRELLAEEENSAAHAALESHLDVCAACRKAFQGLVGEMEGPWQRLRQATLPALRTTPGLGFLEDLKKRSPLALWDGGAAVPLSVPGYELLEKLGQGGMGVVYKARQIDLDRLVALKMIPAGPNGTSVEAERFWAEAQAAARLQHPNIVQVYEVGMQKGLPYFSMELVDGGNLAQRLNNTPQPLREAVRLVATLAQAMEASHRQGVVHRDLKPDNVLFTRAGEPKISDFGLAKRLEVSTGHTLEGSIVGTPGYMAPEQAQGKVKEIGPATDVYALGAILYEMLTGKPPFRAETSLETVLQVIHDEPVPPRQLRPKVPRDLETICLKCLQKEPHRRYSSAGDLAEDLTRFRNGDPIRARPVSKIEKVRRWCCKHPARAGLILALTLLLATLAGIMGTAVVAQRQTQYRTQAELLQQVQLIKFTPHIAKWRQKTWDLVKQAPVKDDMLRDQAISLLEGLDARTVKVFATEASSVALAPDGKRLLLGGIAANGKRPAERARFWDSQAETLRTAGHAGAGPVGFHRDGTPVQFVATEESELLLWDLEKDVRICECRFTDRAFTLANSDLNGKILALAPNGSLAAAAANGPQNTGTTAVWQTDSGKQLFQVPGKVSALAFSVDGTHLAAGEHDGHVTVYSVPSGKRVTSFQAEKAKIHCLAFCPGLGSAAIRGQRRLATGAAGGAVTVWDLESRRAVVSCLGSDYDVYALAFSPDGTLLASGGRGRVKLWDAATGRLLLSSDLGDHCTGLAFSADGKRLATSSLTSSVTLLDLEAGQGVQTLRGLRTPIGRVCFSADGKRIAAVTHDWHVAAWEADSGWLLFHTPGPRGGTADNAGLGFSQDGRFLAVSAGNEAAVWDLSSGEKVGSWALESGLADGLVFQATGNLLLFRAEREQEEGFVFRMRELQVPDVVVRDIRLDGVSSRIFDVVVAPDASCFVVEGVQKNGLGESVRSIRAFDAASGRQRWFRTTQRTALWSRLLIDPSSQLLALLDRDGDEAQLVDLAMGGPRGLLPQIPYCLTAGVEYQITGGRTDPMGIVRGHPLIRRGSRTPLAVLGMDRPQFPFPQFSCDGSKAIWGNADGTVTMCDLIEIRQRLASVGLGW